MIQIYWGREHHLLELGNWPRNVLTFLFLFIYFGSLNSERILVSGRLQERFATGSSGNIDCYNPQSNTRFWNGLSPARPIGWGPSCEKITNPRPLRRIRLCQMLKSKRSSTRQMYMFGLQVCSSVHVHYVWLYEYVYDLFLGKWTIWYEILRCTNTPIYHLTKRIQELV